MPKRSPEVRARMSAARLRVWDDPEFYARMVAARADPIYRAKLSAASRRAWADPVYRAKIARAFVRDRATRSAASRRAALHVQPDHDGSSPLKPRPLK